MNEQKIGLLQLQDHNIWGFQHFNRSLKEAVLGCKTPSTVVMNWCNQPAEGFATRTSLSGCVWSV